MPTARRLATVLQEGRVAPFPPTAIPRTDQTEASSRNWTRCRSPRLDRTTSRTPLNSTVLFRPSPPPPCHFLRDLLIPLSKISTEMALRTEREAFHRRRAGMAHCLLLAEARAWARGLLRPVEVQVVGPLDSISSLHPSSAAHTSTIKADSGDLPSRSPIPSPIQAVTSPVPFPPGPQVSAWASSALLRLGPLDRSLVHRRRTSSLRSLLIRVRSSTVLAGLVTAPLDLEDTAPRHPARPTRPSPNPATLPRRAPPRRLPRPTSNPSLYHLLPSRRSALSSLPARPRSTP